jgi:beta-glucosidase/6-phospho-beta-glucosidase/beta-galactosidase
LDGCNVLGYSAWSLMDNLEWWAGYTGKFGLFHVDFEDPNRRRTPRNSANFYGTVVRQNGFAAATGTGKQNQHTEL